MQPVCVVIKTIGEISSIKLALELIDELPEVITKDEYTALDNALEMNVLLSISEFGTAISKLQEKFPQFKCSYESIFTEDDMKELIDFTDDILDRELH